MNSTVPADRLFWSVIEARGVRAGALPEGLWPLIDDDLPLDASLLWAVGTPADDGQFVVCAVRRDELDPASASLTLTPESIPEYIRASKDAFNFLVGQYEPSPIRRARFRLHLAAAACTLLAAGLTAIGLSRRASSWEMVAGSAQHAANSLIASVARAPNWTKDDIALELMQRRHAGPSEPAPPADAALTLAEVIARWPTHVPGRAQSISATGTDASISVTLTGDVQPFLAALKPPEGWTLDEPRLASIDKATRLNLELHQSKGAP